MGAAYDRGLILYRQRRYEQARAEFANELAQPGAFIATLAMMSLSLAQEGKYYDSRRMAEDAISRAPHYAFNHYALAYAIYRYAFVNIVKVRYGRMVNGNDPTHRRQTLAEAEKVLREALRLEPTESDYFSLLSAIKYDLGLWQDSLEVATAGLVHHPRHDRCMIRRSSALLKLKRFDEAAATARQALTIYPEHSGIHLVLAQVLMHQNAFAEAGDHFAETLRNDPSNADARQGLLETRCARRVVYRPLLFYVLFFQRHKPRMKIFALRLIPLFILGPILLAMFFPRDSTISNGVVAGTFIGLLIVGALIIVPLFFTRILFSIFLLFDPIGRRCLTRLEKVRGIMMMLVPVWIISAWALINFNVVHGDDQAKVFAGAAFLTVLAFTMLHNKK